MHWPFLAILWEYSLSSCRQHARDASRNHCANNMPPTNTLAKFDPSDTFRGCNILAICCKIETINFSTLATGLIVPQCFAGIIFACTVMLDLTTSTLVRFIVTFFSDTILYSSCFSFALYLLPTFSSVGEAPSALSLSGKLQLLPFLNGHLLLCLCVISWSSLMPTIIEGEYY